MATINKYLKVRKGVETPDILTSSATIYGFISIPDPTENSHAATKKYVTESASAAEFNANSYTNTEIANLIASAPDGLNTLNELAAAINDDPDFYISVSASLSQYLTLASASATYYTKTESEEIFVLKTFGTTSLDSNSLIDGGGP